MATAREPLENPLAEAAERQIEERLAELERAEAEGRLFELIQSLPPVREQLRSFLDDADPS